MNKLVPREHLEEVFDQVIREITLQAAGIALHPSQAALNGEVYTVYIAFARGFETSLALCAGLPFYVRLARGMTMEESVRPQDVEAVAKEYLNVLGGHIAARLFSKTKVHARFSVPAFYRGQYRPEGYKDHIILTYSSDKNERLQLIHQVPEERPTP